MAVTCVNEFPCQCHKFVVLLVVVSRQVFADIRELPANTLWLQAGAFEGPFEGAFEALEQFPHKC